MRGVTLILCECSGKRDIRHILLHNDRKHSRLAAYAAVVLQQFDFIKVCIGTQGFLLKSQLFL